MTSPTTNHPNATIGTCSCAVAGDPNFTGYVASQFFFVPTDATDEWHIVTSNGHEGRYQILGFTLPNEGDQINKRYSLGPDSSAFVSYQPVVPGGHLPYTPTGGHMIVTVDTNKKNSRLRLN